MKVAGIIAEYNPFHNGHAYHIEEVRKRTGADYVVVIMSGNFVQRGGPAIADKYIRTKMALLGGADLVIELPTIAATASAETFSRCGVSILNALGIVTHLGFGCETDDLDLLWALASLFAEEPAEYQYMLSSYLKKGLSYPAARACAAGEYFQKNVPRNVQGNVHNNASTDDTFTQKSENDSVFSNENNIIYDSEIIENTLNNPNNILAIEYLKALKQIGSNMKPCPILRKGNGYHDENISGVLSSATAIRNKIFSYDIFETDMLLYNAMVAEEIVPDFEKDEKVFRNFLENTIPPRSVEALIEYFKTARPICEDDFSQLLQYKLCLESCGGNKFHLYADVKEELANRIWNRIEEYSSFSGFVHDIKTKNMTFTSISRGLVHILLDIKKTDMDCLMESNYAPYVRLLGFRKASALLLNELKKSSIPVISQIAKDQHQLNASALRLLQLDISSSHIYSLVKGNKSGLSVGKNEYRTPLVYV